MAQKTPDPGHCQSRKGPSNTMPITSPDTDRFLKYFRHEIQKSSLDIPPHLTRVATLPSEMFSIVDSPLPFLCYPVELFILTVHKSNKQTNGQDTYSFAVSSSRARVDGTKSTGAQHHSYLVVRLQILLLHFQSYTTLPS